MDRLQLARKEIGAGLRDCREEIEQAMMARVHGISEPDQAADPENLQGLSTTVATALEHAITVIEMGEDRAPLIPTSLLAQARLAGRSGIPLSIVLRRYLAGFVLLGEFVLKEAGTRASLRGLPLYRIFKSQSCHFDRLVAAIAQEYEREASSRPSTSEEIRVERVTRLLAGERFDTGGRLAYDLGGWHIGLVLVGEDRVNLFQRLAEIFDRRSLTVRPHRNITWGWLGGRRKLDSSEVVARGHSLLPPGERLALGEPAAKLVGWRLSHNQAKAAIPFSLHSGKRIVKYAQVGLLASVANDATLVSSLRQLYLAPLAEEPDGGEALRETLRAYFAAGRNITSAAAALNLNRQTVRNRIRAVEAKLNCSLDRCGAEIEVALRLEAALRADDREVGNRHHDCHSHSDESVISPP